MRNSPERVRDTIWTFPEKSGKPPGLETLRFSFSQLTVRASLLTVEFFDYSPFWCSDTHEQRHLYANKAKTEVRHLCLKLYKTGCPPVKRDRKLPAQKSPRNGQLQNEIGTRSERDTNLNILRPLRDKTGQHSRIH